MWCSMFRRCLSLFAIAGFVASQLAAIPHAHAGASLPEQRRHNATPHFHAAHGHGHHSHHHSDSHSERHPNGGAEHSDHSSGQPLGSCLSGADHDADAIFVAGHNCSLWTITRADLSASALQVADLALRAGCLSDHGRTAWPLRWRPHDEVLDGSETYLILRNLRI